MLTSIQLNERLSRFGDDHVGGARWLASHWDEMMESDQSRMLDVLARRFTELSEDARRIVWDGPFSSSRKGRELQFELLRDRGVKLLALMLKSGMKPEAIRVFLDKWLKEAQQII
jgi:hypothetical protein